MGYEFYRDIAIAADSLQDLERVVSGHGASVEQIGRRAMDNAVQVVEGGKVREVWVRPKSGDRSKYRAYASAWSSSFGTSVSSYRNTWTKALGNSVLKSQVNAQQAELDLDHLLADAIAGARRYSHVRLFPVFGPSNRFTGSSHEKHIAGTYGGQSEAEIEQGKAEDQAYRDGIEYMGVFSFAKVANLKLEHALQRGGSGKSRNLNVLDYFTNEQAARNLLRALGVVWW